MAAGQFNRRGTQDLIEGRLGRPIGNPSAQSIVTDRTHPRREDRNRAGRSRGNKAPIGPE